MESGSISIFLSLYRHTYEKFEVYEKNKKILAAAIFLTAGSAVAGPIELDMSSWATDGDGNWMYQEADNSWYQSINGKATVLYDPNQSSINSAISGTISVQTAGDDDWIGFALGYQQGEALQGTGTDYWLVDWKKATQGDAPVGLGMYHVTEGSGSWTKTQEGSGFRQVAAGSNLANTGWKSFTDYTFDILFDSNLIEVFINDTLEMSVTAEIAGVDSFKDGSFGFYNMSQSDVRYSGAYLSPVEEVVSEEGRENLGGPVAVSEPASMALLGFGLLGLMSRRKKKK